MIAELGQKAGTHQCAAQDPCHNGYTNGLSPAAPKPLPGLKTQFRKIHNYTSS